MLKTNDVNVSAQAPYVVRLYRQLDAAQRAPSQRVRQQSEPGIDPPQHRRRSAVLQVTRDPGPKNRDRIAAVRALVQRDLGAGPELHIPRQWRSAAGRLVLQRPTEAGGTGAL